MKKLKCSDIIRDMEQGKEAGTIHPLVRSGYPMWLARKASKGLSLHGVRDFETLALRISEEAGELAQAVLEHRDEGGELGRISEEAVDLGAFCIQVLVTMSEKHGPENVMRALGLWLRKRENGIAVRETDRDSPEKGKKTSPSLKTPQPRGSVLVSPESKMKG